MQPTWAFELDSFVSEDNEALRLQRGDLEAFVPLLERYENRLYRYLLRLSGDTATAEDLFQQTWMRVMTRIGRYDPRRSFDPWLFAIARNLAIDHLRRNSPDSLDEPLPSGDSRADTIASDDPGALEGLLERERRSSLVEKIEALPAIYREALTLRFEEEMTFEEIAELVGRPVSTMKSRVARALEALRRALDARRRATP